MTFVFTDIEGSTRLLRALGDEHYNEVLQRHHQLISRPFNEANGVVVNTDGDSFFAAFDEPGPALRACAEAQASLAVERWPYGAELRVRMGVHVGLAQPRNDDYSALCRSSGRAWPVNAASGGQVFVSEDVDSRLDGTSPFELRSLGRYVVRDFDEPLRIFELHDSRWDTPDVPPRVLPADGHNIPMPATNLLGRDREMGVLSDMVGRHALVTIVGPGGIGKTRLALELGRSVAREWPGGVWLVRLDGVTVAEQIPGAIADAAGVATRHGPDPATDLVDALRAQCMLIILDTCEHLLGVCTSLVGEILAQCPSIGVLATSRVPLGIAAERVWRLSRLEIDTTEGSIGPAVRLFTERAQRGSISTESGSDRGAIAELCRRLDGLPLAIELAAADAHRFSIEDLLGTVEHQTGLPLLRDSTLPTRHRSLDGLISWSYELLSKDEQLVARRLAVLAATFDRGLCRAAVGSSEFEDHSIDEMLWSLVDNSIVNVASESGSTRYRQLTTIRTFLLGKLERDERHAVIERLVDRFIEQFGPTTTRGPTWLSDLAIELDNLRALVTEATPGLVVRQQTIGWIIGRFLDATEAYAVGIGELTRMIDLFGASTPELVAMECLHADLHLRLGDVDGAEALVDHAAGRAEAVGMPPWDDVCVPRSQGDIAMRRNDLDEALRIANAALAASPSLSGAARIWNLVGIASATRGEMLPAADAFERELEAWTVIGDEDRTAWADSNLAEVFARVGDSAGAANHQLRCLEYARASGLRVPCAFSMIVAARLLAERRRWHEALLLQGAADELLASQSFVLFETDIAARQTLVSEALDALEQEAVDRFLDEGKALDVNSAIEMTVMVLGDLSKEGAGDAASSV